MSSLERALLYSIILLGLFRILGIVLDDGQSTVMVGPAGEESEDAGPSDGPLTGTADNFDWNPAGFSREGIPAKLSFTRDGRIPRSLHLTDTQRAYVYAVIVTNYQSLLDHARQECDQTVQAQVDSWETRQSQTLANAGVVLTALGAADEVKERAAHLNLAPALFRTKVCPTIKRYLTLNAYDPHPEAVAVLADAQARAAATQ